MQGDDFARGFRAIYDHAVTLYARGQRGAGTFFDPAQLNLLAASGLTAQHVYDYAEDDCHGGEPGYEQALAIELVRRDYFLNVQGGRPSLVVLDEAELPAKSAAVEGIEWLPRLMPKARAKLRGELPPSLMYCCGGDRRFFKTHGILPAEFLAYLASHEGNEQAVIDWVVARKP
ncbi:MAG: DUF5069 domain-containing protein [Akkermansiaceae bacterium]